MRITQVRVARTYNTLSYTSQRFEVEADVEEDDDPDDALSALALALHLMASKALVASGVTRVHEQSGIVRLLECASQEEGDDDDIPF